MPPLPTWGGSPLECHKRRWKDGCGADECSRASHVVFYRGRVPCDVLFVGEAPGQSEDAIGLPFKGPAGELLQRVIDHTVPGSLRWAVTNVVGCIPTDAAGLKTGEPSHEQVQSCRPKTEEFLRIAAPRLIVCVGSVAHDYLDQDYKDAVRLRRRVPQVWIKHPAAILHSTVAVRGLEVQRCVVQVGNAVQHMIDGTGPFAEAQAPPSRETGTRTRQRYNEKDIPF
jgi:uracil-DNA glycosylase family 4